MEFQFVLFIAVTMFGYALVADRLSRSPISGPMFFCVAGVVGAWIGIVPAPTEGFEGTIAVLLELTLALVLFSDSMVLNLRSWRDDGDLPSRLLGIGMPLMILLGAIAAGALFPELDFWGMAIVGAMLAPTDAALGRPVVSNTRVPARIRETLNIESGLNDGIALPFLLFFIAGAEAEEGANLFQLFGTSVGYALVAGAIVGVLSALAVVWFSERGLMGAVWRQIAVVVVALVSFFAADEVGGSGFIAAFLAGVLFGRITQDRGLDDIGNFADTLAQVLTMTAFFVFGALAVEPFLSHLNTKLMAYALLSLTLVRMIPVGAAMIGAHLRMPTILYVGWFGPRGIASIIFATIVIEESAIPNTDLMVDIMITTVAASILLHGVTAFYGSNRYADWYEREGGDDSDMRESGEIHQERPRPRITGPTGADELPT